MLANIIRNTKKTGIGGGGGGIVTGGDPYYSAVSLLLSMDGTNGSTAFTDSSLNALTVTPVGNTQVSTTQSKYGGASGFFDGTGDYLSISPNTAIDLSSSDFTIEFWIRPAPKTNAVDAAFGYSNYACMFYHNGINWTLEMSSTGFSNQLVISFAVTLNTWQHIAIVRSGTSVVVYKDGVSSASGTFTGTVATSGRTLRIGDNGNSQNINGYIDDFRISRFARYVSTFAPPTAALPTTASSTPADPYYGYTSLLLHMDGTSGSTDFVDSGPNALTVTAVGNAQISTTQSKYGGASGSFDGTGDYLTVASNAALAFGTGDFTVEFWMYITSRKAYGYILNTQGGTNALYVSFDAAGNYLRLTNDTTVYAISPTLNLAQWYHISVVRSNGSSRVYVDGVGGTAVACSASFVQTGPLVGGTASANYFQGYIDDLRITKYARYTSAFTPPTQAHLEYANGNDRHFSNVSLLLHMDGANGSTTFTDNSANALAVTPVGNTQISTTQSKYGGASAYFDGAGDSLTASGSAGQFAFGANPFTIEFWLYAQNVTTRQGLYSNNINSSGGLNSGPVFAIRGLGSTGKLGVGNVGQADRVETSDNAILINTWHHIALVREGTSTNQTKIYVDGVIAGQGTMADNFSVSRDAAVGRTIFYSEFLNGFIDDFRITKGVARTFTAAPTSAFPNA